MGPPPDRSNLEPAVSKDETDGTAYVGAAPEAALAHEIRRRREAAGLSQTELACLVGYSREYVSRAERPRRGLASGGVVEAIDAALGAGGALTALHGRLHEQRLVRRTPTKATAVEPGRAPRSASVGTGPRDHANDLAELQHVDQGDGPEQALPGVEDLLDGICEDLTDSRGTDRGVLLRTAARAAEFAGFLHRDLGAGDRCLYWHDRAMEFAQQANDRPMQAYVLLRKAQAAYDRRDASRMLDLTLAAAWFDTVVGSGLRAEIVQQQARGEAMLGAKVDDVRRRLDDASTALAARQDAASNDEPGQHYTERLLGLQSALCLSEAGRPRDAVVRYREIISADLSRRDHAYFSILMATSLALSGEPDEAAQIGCSSLPVAIATASRRSIREARTLVSVLRPWRERSHVRHLQELLRPVQDLSAS